tara:strand:+ start:104 stop:367 length:264 start_codon:yes stop_codon:yes gene_type:complete
MIKEIKYFIFFLIISLFLFLTINFYISDINIKKTFRNINAVEKNIGKFESTLPLITNDTENIVKYLSKENISDKKKYSFWELLKNEN